MTSRREKPSIEYHFRVAKLRVNFAPPSDRAPFEISLGPREVLIGKSAEKCFIVINDSRISREHARIFLRDGAYLIEDRGSKNGTWLDGTRLPPQEPRALKEGSTVAFEGVCGIVYTEHDEFPTDVDVGGEAPVETLLCHPAAQVASDSIVIERDALLASSPKKLADHIESLDGLVKKQAQRLNLLYALGKSLSSVFSLEEIYRRVSDVLFEVTPVDRCCILLTKEGQPELVPALVRTRDGKPLAAGALLPISRTIVERVVSERVSLASFFAQKDTQLRAAASIIAQGIQAVICAPLLGRGGVLGVIYADRQCPKDTFTTDDLELLNAIAGATSSAIDNAKSYELLSREALARAAYGRFLPRHVVESILAKPESVTLGSSNQTVTVLFADIRGFTPLAEKRKPEEVVRFLNAYFQAMTTIVFSHGGTLDKYIGDGLMALFGAPCSSPQDAANAVRAASAMQRRLASLRDEEKDAGFRELGIGIGINTGEVTVGYMGSSERLDYTVIGDTVNLAARLEQSAQAGQIRISRSTRDGIGDGFEAKPLGEIHVKGREGAERAFEVLW